MTWFSLPAYRKDTPPAFVDMDGCNAWLATQPLANAPAMQDALAKPAGSAQRLGLPARRRYKILRRCASRSSPSRAESGKPLRRAPVTRYPPSSRKPSTVPAVSGANSPPATCIACAPVSTRTPPSPIIRPRLRTER